MIHTSRKHRLLACLVSPGLILMRYPTPKIDFPSNCWTSSRTEINLFFGTLYNVIRMRAKKCIHIQWRSFWKAIIYRCGVLPLRGDSGNISSLDQWHPYNRTEFRPPIRRSHMEQRSGICKKKIIYIPLWFIVFTTPARCWYVWMFINAMEINKK